MEYTCPYCGVDQETDKTTCEYPSSFNWMQTQETPIIRDADYMRTACCEACQQPVVLFQSENGFQPYKTCEGVGLNALIGVDCPICGGELAVNVNGRFVPVGMPRQEICKHCEGAISIEIEPNGHVQVEEIPVQYYPCPYCSEKIPFAGNMGNEPIAAFCDHCDSLIAVAQKDGRIEMLKTYENEELIDEDFHLTCPHCGKTNAPQIGVHPLEETFSLSCVSCHEKIYYRYEESRKWTSSNEPF